MISEETIVIGEVLGTHGVKGVLKVRSYADSTDIFKPDTEIFVEDRQGKRDAHTVLWTKPHNKAMLMALDGVEDLDLAESLVGVLLYIDKKMLPTLEDGTYYWFELIGLDVYTVESEYLGVVDSIFPTGSNDVLVVKNPRKGAKHEVLIPAMAEVIQSVSIEEKTIRVKLPEGL